MSQDARAPREERIDVGGVGIFVRSWQPESGAPRALVVVCHGVNSHGGQYLSTGGQLAARGFAAWALDLRGRGRSDGARFHVDDVGDCVHDVAAVAALEADPLTANEAQPASTVAALVRANERLAREFPRITLPVLILWNAPSPFCPPTTSPSRGSSTRPDWGSTSCSRPPWTARPAFRASRGAGSGSPSTAPWRATAGTSASHWKWRTPTRTPRSGAAR